MQNVNVNAIESVNAVVENVVVEAKVAPIYGVEYTETEFTDADALGLDFSKVSKALRDLLKAAHALPQALQALNGLMCLPLNYDGVEMTAGELINKCGFEAGKKNLGIKALLQGWRYKAENGRLQIWRNVGGRISQEGEDTESKKHNAYRVYTYVAGKNGGFKPVNKWERVTVDDNRWTVEMIICGIVQTAFPEKMQKKHAEAEKKWAKVDNVYRFEKSHNKNGETNKAIEVRKESVVF